MTVLKKVHVTHLTCGTSHITCRVSSLHNVLLPLFLLLKLDSWFSNPKAYQSTALSLNTDHHNMTSQQIVPVSSPSIAEHVVPAHPEPPYTEEDDAKLEHGLQCYYPTCVKKYHSYGRLMEHVRSFHARRTATLSGTYMHLKAREELNATQKSYYHKSQKGRVKGVDDGGDKSIKQQKRQKISADLKIKIDKPDEDNTADRTDQPEEGTCTVVWKPMLCWVKCSADGQPCHPFETRGLVEPDNVAEHVGVYVPASDVDEVPMAPPEVTVLQQNSIIREQISLRPAIRETSACHQSPALFHGTVDARTLTPMQMMTEMYAGFKSKQGTEFEQKNWKAKMPSVNVKKMYRDHPAPTARQEGVERATWPRELYQDKVQLPEFATHLRRLNKKSGIIGSYTLGAGRALGCLEVLSDTVAITDVKVLVGFFLDGQYNDLIDIPLLHPKFSWTGDLLSGLVNYVNYWLREAKQRSVRGGPEDVKEPWHNYAECLECLITFLKSGHMQRCKEFKEKGYAAKAQKDLFVLKNFPSIKEVVQPAVRRGYCILRAMAEKYANCLELPPQARTLANAIVTGAWEYDTFMGRKWEIEHVLFTTIDDAINNGAEYILCSQHKTSRTYGDIIKYLTPGLIQALIAYRSLPRAHAGNYFFVPVGSSETIHIPKSLQTFNRNFLKGSKVMPTTNQIRKKFHRELMNMTKDEDALKAFMVILDGHGRKVQDKHYLIKEPEDDLACAKVLVSRILGDTVAWPSKTESEAEVLGHDFESFDDDQCADEDIDADGDLDLDDEPLDEWKNGELFGISPFGALDVIPLADVDHVDSSSEHDTDKFSKHDIDEAKRRSLHTSPGTSQKIEDMKGVKVRQNQVPSAPAAAPYEDRGRQSELTETMVFRKTAPSAPSAPLYEDTTRQALLNFKPAPKAAAPPARRRRASTVFSVEQCLWLEARYTETKQTGLPDNGWCREALLAGRKLKTDARLLKMHDVEQVRQYMRTHLKYMNG